MPNSYFRYRLRQHALESDRIDATTMRELQLWIAEGPNKPTAAEMIETYIELYAERTDFNDFIY